MYAFDNYIFKVIILIIFLQEIFLIWFRKVKSCFSFYINFAEIINFELIVEFRKINLIK